MSELKKNMAKDIQERDKRCMCLTLDYELYGNGSGDVFKHIIEPTQKILEICKSHDALITIFFEVVEYWKLREEWERGNHMGYQENPIEAMEKQLIQAYENGHDVQLHIHPQWVDAKWTDNGWIVNKEEWRLGGFREQQPNELYQLIKKGKETVENIIRQVDSSYHCTIIRAGGYNIQPSSEIVKVMNTLGLVADSSVVPGSIETGSLSRYNFSNVPIDKGSWRCGNRLEIEGDNGMMEFPIVAFPITRWRKYLSWEKFLSILQNRKSARDTFNAKTTETSGNKKKKLSKIHYFFEKEYQTWDYCLFSNALHRRFLKEIEKQNNRDVFVLVGHPKSFVNGSGLRYLLKRTANKYQHHTIQQVINQEKC